MTVTLSDPADLPCASEGCSDLVPPERSTGRRRGPDRLGPGRPDRSRGSHRGACSRRRGPRRPRRRRTRTHPRRRVPPAHRPHRHHRRSGVDADSAPGTGPTGDIGRHTPPTTAGASHDDHHHRPGSERRGTVNDPSHTVPTGSVGSPATSGSGRTTPDRDLAQPRPAGVRHDPADHVSWCCSSTCSAAPSPFPGATGCQQFVVPGIFAQTVVFGSAFTGIGIAGTCRRLHRPAPLTADVPLGGAGRAHPTSDLVRTFHLRHRGGRRPDRRVPSGGRVGETRCWPPCCCWR